LRKSTSSCPARPSFAPQRKRSTPGWLKLLNRPYIHPTVDIPSTDAILDETNDDLEEYDASNDDNKSRMDETDANGFEWTLDDNNDALTAPRLSDWASRAQKLRR
jgi:hypothetical protein